MDDEGRSPALFGFVLKLKKKKGRWCNLMSFWELLTLSGAGGFSPCVSFCLVVLVGSFVYTAPVRPFKLLLMF